MRTSVRLLIIFGGSAIVLWLSSSPYIPRIPLPSWFKGTFKYSIALPGWAMYVLIALCAAGVVWSVTSYRPKHP